MTNARYTKYLATNELDLAAAAVAVRGRRGAMAPVARRTPPDLTPRLLAEAFGTTLAVIAIVQSDGSRAMPALKPRRSCRSATVGEVRPPPRIASVVW